jgi:hypothetical protein
MSKDCQVFLSKHNSNIDSDAKSSDMWKMALRDAEGLLREAEERVLALKFAVQTCKRRIESRDAWPGDYQSETGEERR